MIVKADWFKKIKIKKITFTLENDSTDLLDWQSFGIDASNIFKRQEMHVMKQDHAQNRSAVRNFGTEYIREANQ